MNNMILIRGGKIAFSRLPGNYGSLSHNCHDLTELILMPYGLFIPCHEHGMQVFNMVDTNEIFKPLDAPGPYTANTGNKGVLISPSGKGKVGFYQFRLLDDRKLNTIPLKPGKYGFSIITCYDVMEQLMAMAVRLTQTIEEAVDMYCRHTSSNRSHVEIWTEKDLFEFLNRHHRPKAVEMLLNDQKYHEKREREFEA